ncbi:MAG: ATP-binding cassette domain-containing protein, partial [Gemmatimonadota bacterium]
MIKLDGVRKSYGAVTALDGVSAHLEAGRTTVLIGPSGCGKSTLLRTLIGLVWPDEGVVRVADVPVADATVRRLRHRTGYVIQEGGLFPHLTARDNATLVARHLGWDQADVAGRVEEVARLVQFPPERLDAWPGQLSGGQRQ